MSVIELRQYTLKPGRRDVLIALFEREFVETQEEAGMTLIGTFCDADNADRFVWLRSFPDMESRARSLARFYGGPVWKAHREAANATIADSDNVLLLHPAWNGSDFAREGSRTSRSTTPIPRGFVIAAIWNFHDPVPGAFVSAFRDSALSRRAATQGKCVATLVTERSTNTFPALPVREGENVFVWFASCADSVAASACADIRTLPQEFEAHVSKPVEILRLLPTARSQLHA